MKKIGNNADQVQLNALNQFRIERNFSLEILLLFAHFTWRNAFERFLSLRLAIQFMDLGIVLNKQYRFELCFFSCNQKDQDSPIFNKQQRCFDLHIHNFG